MADVTFKLNLKGLNELMKSSQMQSALLEAGNQVADAAGKDHEAEVYNVNWIAISKVSAKSWRAISDNKKNNTLLKALGSVGLPMRK